MDSSAAALKVKHFELAFVWTDQVFAQCERELLAPSDGSPYPTQDHSRSYKAEKGRSTVCRWYFCLVISYNLPFRDDTLPLLSAPAPPSKLPGLIKVKFLPWSKEAHLHPGGKQPVMVPSKGLLIQSGCSSVRPYHHRHGHLWEPHHRASWSCWLRLVETESQKEACITTFHCGPHLIRSDSQRTGRGLNNTSHVMTAALGMAQIQIHTGNAT